jgi:hypothetical protein
MAAGYKNWDEYKSADYKWKENILPAQISTGAALNAAGNSANTTVVNVTNNNGGNISSVRSNSVSNNVPTHMPIYTGSMAMGY